MRSHLAVLLGKFIFTLTRSLKFGGGSAAPGLYALKVDPKLVEKLVKKIPQNIVITGTNGKTTTSRMIAHFASSQGLKVIRNHTGSNLERGIASTLISNYNLQPSAQARASLTTYNLGIWELDEAAFNNVAPKLNPQVVVFLNVFRDQLDRYGEIDTIIKGWVKTLNKLPKETIVLVNGDDENTKKLAKYFKGKVFQFGVKDYKIAGEGILHKKEKENLNCEAKDVKLNGLKGSSFQLAINNKQLTINLPLPGVYHIYDFLAAFYAGHKLSFDTNKMISSLKTFSPAFGRMEKIKLNPGSHRTLTSEVGYIFLIKNPAGATQVFQTIAPQLKPQDRLLFVLNDNLADGTDVSWIWDANFELLQRHPELVSGSFTRKMPKQVRHDIIASGARTYDLAVRLKYAGFPASDIHIEPNLEKAFRIAQEGLKGQLFVLTTYTAMLELQGILTKQGIKKNYWEDN